MAVLPDRRVLHTSRDGRVWLTTPNATTSLAGTIPVYSHDEDGLQGIAIDADFATNRWVYVYYAPPLTTPSGDAPNDGVVVRRLQGPQPALAGQADRRRDARPARPSSRSSRSPPTAASAATPAARSTSTPRATCTSRPATTRTRSRRTATRRSTSARAATRPTTRSAAPRTRTTCAASCCGSRSPPTARYTVPDGNLFAPGTDKTRPEIYAMGFRNPFRFAIDRSTGWVYLGDYGPDAGGAEPEPRARRPGRVQPDQERGQLWLAVLPRPQRRLQRLRLRHRRLRREVRLRRARRTPSRATPAWSTCRRRARRGSPTTPATCPQFGCGSESPMGGPIYHFDAANPSKTKFPAYFDGKNFAYEFGRGWIRTLTGTDETAMPDDRVVHGLVRLQAADQHRVRPRRLAVRARLRHRLLRRRREQRRLPRRLRAGHAHADRRAARQQDLRPGAADRRVRRHRLTRPGRAPRSPTRGTSTATASTDSTAIKPTPHLHRSRAATPRRSRSPTPPARSAARR